MSGSMDFGDFLNKMGTETSGKKKRVERPVEPVFEETRPPKREPSRKRTPPPNNDFIEPTPEPVREEVHTQESRIDEEFMDKAYDYAQGVIKVVRQNFRSTDERVAMLESLNKAIVYYLNSVGAQPSTPMMRESVSTQSNTHSSGLFGGATMSESEWNNMPKTSHDQTSGAVRMNDLTGQPVDIKPPTGDYKKDLKIGIKIAPDGKQEADLSGVTPMDINEMKVLAGMIGPEKETKDRELAAAKQAVAQQIADKENQPG